MKEDLDEKFCNIRFANICISACAKCWTVNMATRMTKALGNESCVHEMHRKTGEFTWLICSSCSERRNSHWSCSKKVSILCYIFLRKGRTITSTIPGTVHYSHDLVQGGMEVPCTLHFRCNSKKCTNWNLNFCSKYLKMMNTNAHQNQEPSK